MTSDARAALPETAAMRLDITAALKQKKQSAIVQRGPQWIPGALADYRLLHGDETSLTIAEEDEEGDVSNASTAPVGGLRTAAEEQDVDMEAVSAGGNAAGDPSSTPVVRGLLLLRVAQCLYEPRAR